MSNRSTALIAALTIIALAGGLSAPRPARAATCQPTGFNGLTAAVVDPASTVSGTINATGCDIGVYFDSGHGQVSGAEVYGALWYGIVVNGDSGNPSVVVTNSRVHNIGDSPFNGDQRGVAIYYRAYLSGSTSGKIWNNTISLYQKGGIVTNGSGTSVDIKGNTVTGFGPTALVAQNGIQIGYGESAQVKDNTVTGHSYTGTGAVSGGIIAVGGPGYDPCPTASAHCAYTAGTDIEGNTVLNNDVGVFLTNLDATDNPPASATNIKAVGNTISDATVTNGYIYQAGVSDVGNNDKIINNDISGSGYLNTPNCATTCRIDTTFTNKPTVHAND